ncbi:MAG: hypothetical protein Q9219_006959 [cf. Caloplaca sp. 3 TL-2023]
MGPLESVIHDCCGFCPEPKTDEERETAEEESKIYVSGDLEFMKDDPGRQAIGSFNPLTDDDWTEMAYIGNTQELCQRISDGDLDFVEEWCKENHDAVDRRDHTGRTPLHLAAQCSTPEVLKCLVDNGARIVSRLVDGMTALHIAAARGNADMVTILLEKSEANEAEEAEKEDRKKAAKKGSRSTGNHSAEEETMEMDKNNEEKDEDSDEEMDDVSSEHDTAMTEGSFVKVNEKKQSDEDALDNDGEDEPDVYDVNVLAWDTPVSPLHLAILGGYSGVIKTLISSFGADALLPVKIINKYTRSPQHAIMTLVLAARLVNASSARVTHDLLAHGASSAQADIHRVSSFHYLAAKKKVELLKVCINEDGAVAKSALNHLVVDASYYRPSVYTPLTTAISTGDSALVRYLLEVGAKPTVDLDSFAAAYSAAKENRSYWRIENVSKVWREEITQPILLAVQNDMPEVIIKLLDAGADINTISKDAHESIAQVKANDKHHLHGQSVLDATLSKIKDLETAIERRFDHPKPPTLEKDSSYLKGAKAGSYAYWYLSKSLMSGKTIVDDWDKCRAKKAKEEEERPGKEQRISALKDMKARFVELHQHLERRGAKTLEELHPDISRPKDDDDEDQNTTKKVEFEVMVRFRVSASEEVLGGYMQLFEAAWEGRDEKIKELTLANWGPDSDKKPLRVAVQDEKGFTPFAIATYRRHFGTARLLLQVADAQFKEPNESNTKRRYELAGGSDDYDSENSDDTASEGGDSDDLNISSKVVDETYTYDNVAALQDSVGSKISAAEMLRKPGQVWWFIDKSEKEARNLVGAGQFDIWGSLGYSETTSRSQVLRKARDSSSYTYLQFGRYAMASRDLSLFRFWLQCCQESLKMKRNDQYVTTGFDSREFQFALEHGLVEEAAEMIKILGAELPLDALIKKTGVDDSKKHTYYQGLSIGGQKMTSWARERGGDIYRSAMGESTPPLLQAAHAGNLAAVEWFLSDTPLRYYREHKDKNKDDSRLRKLADAPGGFQSVVGSWLKQRNNLALHGAILSDADEKKTLEVVEYLIEVMPESIDLPSVHDELTPLALAFLKGRLGAAKALIQAGADQTTRDKSGKNLVHLALINASKTTPADTKKFRELLDLIDKRLIRSLFVERCKDGPGGLTPLGLGLAKPTSSRSYYSNRSHTNAAPEVLSMMLEFGGEEPLRMMDGSGQFPLHLAVKTSHTAMVKSLLEKHAALLTRENAMGQTPLELAHSLYVRECAKSNPSLRGFSYKALESREPKDFIVKKKNKDDASLDDEEGLEDPEWDTDIVRTWKICQRYADGVKGRTLVSVNEARAVAKRLADRKKRESEEAEREEEEEKRGREKGGEDGKKKGKEDEVDKWLGSCALELS